MFEICSVLPDVDKFEIPCAPNLGKNVIYEFNNFNICPTGFFSMTSTQLIESPTMTAFCYVKPRKIRSSFQYVAF